MQFSAQLENLPKMLEFIKKAAHSAGLDERSMRHLELASEEALVNVISYAYPEQKGEISLDCYYTPTKGFEIVIKDQGMPFNPIEANVSVPRDLPIEKRPIGGLGLYLMRQLMDEVSYQRTDNENILKLTLRL